MKKQLLLVLFGLSLTFMSFGQQITGIGYLKLGSNISIMKQFEPIGKIDGVLKGSYGMTYSFCHKESSWNAVEYISDTNVTYQIMTGSIVHSRPFLVKECRTFEISNPVKLNEEVQLENVRLIFFNDTLISIECKRSTELTEALDLKYGKVEPKIIETPHTFTRTINGTQITLTDITSTIDRSAGNITCESVVGKYYSNSVEPKYYSYFILEYKDAINSISFENKKYEQRAEKRSLDKKKANLKDF